VSLTNLPPVPAAFVHLTPPPASPSMSMMRIGILPCLLAVLTVGCHEVPYEDLMDAPRQLVIDGTTYIISAWAEPDYIVGVYGPTPLNVGITVTSSDSSRAFPSTLRADRLWAIRSQDEIWEVVLLDREAHSQPYSIRYSAGDGPRWPADIWISVAARVRSDDGRTWYLRDPQVHIANPEGGPRVGGTP